MLTVDFVHLFPYAINASFRNVVSLAEPSCHGRYFQGEQFPRSLSRADQSLTLLSHSRQELSSGFERPRGSRRQTCTLGRHRLGGESAHALVYSYAGFLIFSRGEV